MNLRPPTQAELDLVRHSWRRRWRLMKSHTQASKSGGRERVMRWGDGYITRRVASSYLHAFIDATATQENCLVLAAPTDNGGEEPLAWVCRELQDDYDGARVCTLHFVYVVKAARGKGLAKALVGRVCQEAKVSGVHVEPSHINGQGSSLLRHFGI